MKVERKAIRDLLAATHGSLKGQREVLQILKDVLPDIEAGNDTLAIEKAADRECQRKSLYSELGRDTMVKFYRRLVCELQHHTDPRALVYAAMEAACHAEGDTCWFKRKTSEIKATFANLDKRTLEIFAVFDELWSVDGNINTDFLNEIPTCVPKEVTEIRKEPALALLVEAYDKARAVNEIQE